MTALYIAAGFIGTLLILVIASIISWKLKPAIFLPVDQMPCETLKRNHDDWWWFFKWVPRRVTAFLGGRGDPVQLLGSNPKGHNQDVPAQGTWCLSWPFHVAVLSSTKRILFGFGVRRDYYENYWTLRAVWRAND